MSSNEDVRRVCGALGVIASGRICPPCKEHCSCTLCAERARCRAAPRRRNDGGTEEPNVQEKTRQRKANWFAKANIQRERALTLGRSVLSEGEGSFIYNPDEEDDEDDDEYEDDDEDDEDDEEDDEE